MEGHVRQNGVEMNRNSPLLCQVRDPKIIEVKT